MTFNTFTRDEVPCKRLVLIRRLYSVYISLVYWFGAAGAIAQSHPVAGLARHV